VRRAVQSMSGALSSCGNVASAAADSGDGATGDAHEAVVANRIPAVPALAVLRAEQRGVSALRGGLAVVYDYQRSTKCQSSTLMPCPGAARNLRRRRPRGPHWATGPRRRRPRPQRGSRAASPLSRRPARRAPLTPASARRAHGRTSPPGLYRRAVNWECSAREAMVASAQARTLCAARVRPTKGTP
jgi:hypothetical protein